MRDVVVSGQTLDEEGFAEALMRHPGEDEGAGVPSSAECPVCQGLFTELEDFAALVMDEIEGWEWETFLVGTKVDSDIVTAEEELWAELGAEHAEPVKAEVNREVGKLIETATGKRANLHRPDIAALLDTRYDTVELSVAPLFMYGRYRKLVRNIPQTRWPCTKCRGKGCEKCGGTGKLYQESVEELIAFEAMKATGGTEHSFHGMGREDIDARMLGNGRPFVLEITRPRVRSLNYPELERAMNRHAPGKVEVSGLRSSERKEVARVKELGPPKSYQATVELEREVGEEEARTAVEGLRGVVVKQRTPTRVAHRRADMVRERKVHDIRLDSYAPKTLVINIKGEKGIYIKELMHGDAGRTSPSLAELLNAACEVAALDVLEIHDQPDGSE